MAAKVTQEMEDLLLAYWEQRRKLSEKTLCERFDIGRSTLRNAVKRAQARRRAQQLSKLISDTDPVVG